MWKIFDTAPTSDYHTPTFNRKSGLASRICTGRLEKIVAQGGFFYSRKSVNQTFQRYSRIDYPFQKLSMMG